jgi:hypothetical protein
MEPVKQLTIVYWDDAWQDQENFTTAHGIRATHAPMLVETQGRLVQDDETGISIANERSTQDGVEVFRGRTFIPRAMIKDVLTYNLVKPRKPKPEVEVLP